MQRSTSTTDELSNNGKINLCYRLKPHKNPVQVLKDFLPSITKNEVVVRKQQVGNLHPLSFSSLNLKAIDEPFSFAFIRMRERVFITKMNK